MKKILTRTIFIFSAVIIFSAISYSQTISLDMDVYSRYNWRGADIGNSPSFQPYVTFTTGGFSIGAWGAYSFGMTSDHSTYSESDLWASYAVSTESGTYSLVYTDYFLPYLGLKYSNYKSDGNGAHTLEIGFTYGGPDSFPITIAGYYNFRNDPDKSTYFQVGYPFTVKDVNVTLFAGATGGKSAYYGGMQKFSFINTGITFQKTITVTDKFSIPATSSLIYNPYAKQLYLIFGVTL